jgi:hypothetical protein
MQRTVLFRIDYDQRFRDLRRCDRMNVASSRSTGGLRTYGVPVDKAGADRGRTGGMVDV